MCTMVTMEIYGGFSGFGPWAKRFKFALTTRQLSCSLHQLINIEPVVTPRRIGEEIAHRAVLIGLG